MGWSEDQSSPVGEPLESGLTEATVISHPSSFWRVFEVSGVTAPTQRFRQACEWNCVSWLARRAYIQPAGLGWVLLSQFSPFRYFPNFSALWVHTLVIEYHIHICQVSPQLNYGDTCQIWMLLKEFNRYICNIENFVYREINEWSFSDPHSWYVAKYTGNRTHNFCCKNGIFCLVLHVHVFVTEFYRYTKLVFYSPLDWYKTHRWKIRRIVIVCGPAIFTTSSRLCLVKQYFALALHKHVWQMGLYTHPWCNTVLTHCGSNKKVSFKKKCLNFDSDVIYTYCH